MKNNVSITSLGLSFAIIATFVLGLSGCPQTSQITEHEHTYRNDWTFDEEHHWHESTCEHFEKLSDRGKHVWDDGVITKGASEEIEGEKIFSCKICSKTKTVILEKVPFNCYSTPIDAITGEVATTNSTDIYFGVFPQFVLPLDNTINIDESDSVIMGNNNYYKGSDGFYYAKILENACRSDYVYTDGSLVQQKNADSYRYFKVEPIRWKVITKDYEGTGNVLLLAENILFAGVPYYEESEDHRTIAGERIYPSNYKHSQIRAYLNGLVYQGQDSKVARWKDQGFLQTAFTTAAQQLITETIVDNSSDTTNRPHHELYYADFTCESTQDKVFLLSIKDVTGVLGLNEWDERTVNFVITDYAQANYGSRDWCWLRSPSYRHRNEIIIFGNYFDGSLFELGSPNVSWTTPGIVPALCISLN